MTTEATTYNGWTNYETWNVALWLGNDEGSYSYWQDATQEAWNDAEADETWTREEAAAYSLSERLESEIKDSVPDLGASMFADLLGAALSEVNWREIAENWLADVDKDDEAADSDE